MVSSDNGRGLLMQEAPTFAIEAESDCGKSTPHRMDANNRMVSASYQKLRSTCKLPLVID